MKKAVFFDIDGTLWNYQMQIPESTVLAIRETERKWTLCIYLQWKKPFEYTKSKIIGDWI